MTTVFGPASPMIVTVASGTLVYNTQRVLTLTRTFVDSSGNVDGGKLKLSVRC
jgi:hypothetical protein